MTRRRLGGYMTTTTPNVGAAVGNFIRHAVGATVLDGAKCEDVEAGRRAAPQATVIVVLASLAPTFPSVTTAAIGGPS